MAGAGGGGAAGSGCGCTTADGSMFVGVFVALALQRRRRRRAQLALLRQSGRSLNPAVREEVSDEAGEEGTLRGSRKQFRVERA